MKERLEVLRKIKEELKLYRAYLLHIKLTNEIKKEEKVKTLAK